MKHLMVCISGFSGVGKDEVAEYLVDSYRAVHMGLVDSAKRHMADLYGFTENQLFGPSTFRNEGDKRYPKPIYFKLKAKPYDGVLSNIFDQTKTYHYVDVYDDGVNSVVDKSLDSCQIRQSLINNTKRFFIEETNGIFFLSPREALQKYCELMDSLFLGSWAWKAMNTSVAFVNAMKLDNNRYSSVYKYSRMKGIVGAGEVSNYGKYVITCFSDFRHICEFKIASAFQSETLFPIFLRVKRPGIDKPPFDHRSEKEQALIPDNAFDFIINNDSTISDLRSKIDPIVELITKPDWVSTRTEI